MHTIVIIAIVDLQKRTNEVLYQKSHQQAHYQKIAKLFDEHFFGAHCEVKKNTIFADTKKSLCNKYLPGKENAKYIDIKEKTIKPLIFSIGAT